MLVIMNAAAALFLGGAAADLGEGARLAARAIDSGEARRKLDLLIEATSSVWPPSSEHRVAMHGGYKNARPLTSLGRRSACSGIAARQHLRC